MTVNIEADPPGYRPSKKKKATAKKKAASGKAKKPGKSKAAAPVKKAGKPTAAAPSKKVPSSGRKPGKSSTPAKKSGRKPTRKSGAGGRKPGKSTASKKPAKVAGLSGGKTASKTKKPKKSSVASVASAVAATPKATGGAKRPYTKRLPEGVDIAALKPAKEYGISRIEQETKKNFGYYVRVGPPEERSSIFFSDKKHGSSTKALKAAVEKRNELFAALPDWYKVRASKKRKVA